MRKLRRHEVSTFAVALAAVLLGAAARPAAAHDPGLSSTTIVVGNGEAAVRMRFHERDLAATAADDPGSMLQLHAGTAAAAAPIAARPIREDAGDVGFDLRFDLPAGELRFEFPVMARLSPGHRHLVEVVSSGGSVLLQRLLSRDARSVVVPAVATTGGKSRFLAWLGAGAEHIALGLDHLLFVFVLLLGAPGPGAGARLVTAFTAGHSVSLLLGATGLLALPAAVVEPAIAASIVVVALPASVGQSVRERYAVACAFGLVHGLGFASAFTEMQAGRAGIADTLAAVASFNLGVEAGQLLFGAVMLGTLMLLRGSARFRRHGVRFCGTLAVASGAFWFVERVL